MAETFGQFIREKRNERDYTLGELSRRIDKLGVHVAASSLSRYEQDAVYISEDVGHAVFEALELTPSEMKEGKRLLNQHIETFVPRTPYKKSGQALENILTRVDSNSKELSHYLDVYYQFIRDCIIGEKAFPSNSFKKLTAWLKSKGAADAEIARFTAIYVKDLITNSKQLQFLPKSHLQKIGEFAASLFE